MSHLRNIQLHSSFGTQKKKCVSFMCLYEVLHSLCELRGKILNWRWSIHEEHLIKKQKTDLQGSHMIQCLAHVCGLFYPKNKGTCCVISPVLCYLNI